MNRFGVTGALVVCLAFRASLAAAQNAPELRAHRVTINAGVTSLGSYDVGDSTASLRGNGIGLTTPAFTLFSADARLSSATAPELRVGMSLTRRLTIEAGATLGHPGIGVSISGDAEAASQELPGEELEQFLFDGALNWQLPIPMGPRLAPYVTGGGGYLRQLHEDRTLAETGQVYYAGGGARFWLRGGHSTTRPVGLRGEFRINLRRRGIDFEDKMRRYPAFSLFAFIGL